MNDGRLWQLPGIALCAWRNFLCYWLGHRIQTGEWHRASLTSAATHVRAHICQLCGEGYTEKGYFDAREQWANWDKAIKE